MTQFECAQLLADRDEVLTVLLRSDETLLLENPLDLRLLLLLLVTVEPLLLCAAPLLEVRALHALLPALYSSWLLSSMLSSSTCFGSKSVTMGELDMAAADAGLSVAVPNCREPT